MAYDFKPYRVQIAQANQRDSKGRRAIMTDDCGSGSTSLYISQDEPYHLVYDNQEADEEFGSFYACGVEGTVYGDGIFYRSATEETPEDCGELILYPECMPLSYTVTTTQGTSISQVPHDAPGAYNSTCYVDVEGVDGAPNDDVSAWMVAPRASFDKVGHVSVDGPSGY